MYSAKKRSTVAPARQEVGSPDPFSSELNIISLSVSVLRMQAIFYVITCSKTPMPRTCSYQNIPFYRSKSRLRSACEILRFLNGCCRFSSRWPWFSSLPLLSLRRLSRRKKRWIVVRVKRIRTAVEISACSVITTGVDVPIRISGVNRTKPVNGGECSIGPVAMIRCVIAWQIWNVWM